MNKTDNFTFDSIREARNAFHQLIMGRDILFNRLRQAINSDNPIVKMKVKSYWQELAKAEENLFNFKFGLNILEKTSEAAESKSTVASSNITERTEVASLSEDVCAVSESAVVKLIK